MKIKIINKTENQEIERAVKTILGLAEIVFEVDKNFITEENVSKVIKFLSEKLLYYRGKEYLPNISDDDLEWIQNEGYKLLKPKIICLILLSKNYSNSVEIKIIKNKVKVIFKAK